jgi:predicted lipid-binding transport protein (Tim44 family)
LSGGDPFDPTFILFAALAVFVIWRLRSVLGVRVDRDKPAPGPVGPVRRSAPAPLPGAPPTVDTPRPAQPVPAAERWKGLAEPGSAAWAGLDAVAAADPSFSGPAFLGGARKAYEMVVAAFAKGDRDTLCNLLSKEVFEDFSGEIRGREQRGETVKSAIVSIDSATVQAARAAPHAIEITVRFVCQLMNERRDSAGELIEGGVERPTRAVDLWTFARDPRSRDPNWRLVATQSGT